MGKRKIFILLTTLFAIYYSSYFITREAIFPNNSVLVVSLGQKPGVANVQLSIPLSKEAIDEYHKSIKRNGKWPLTLTDPVHEFYLFRMRGVIENTIPVNFKFFFPAIVTEASVLFVYSNIIKSF